MQDREFTTEWSGNGAGTGQRTIIGAACWDDFLPIDALSPGRKHRLAGPRVRVLGGGAANCAVVQRRLAPRTRIILAAQRGNDADGATLDHYLTRQNIELPLPPLADAATSGSWILTEREGRSTIVTQPGARAVPIPPALIQQSLEGASACCLTAPGVNEQIPAILRIARQQGVPVYFGAGGAQIYGLGYDGLEEALADGVEMLICNRVEAKVLTGSDDIVVQLQALQLDGRVHLTIITDGAHGLHAMQDGQMYNVPAYRDPTRPVVDDTGAGDAAEGAIVDMLVRGYPLEIALRAGARQGFEACTAFGATTHLLDEGQMNAFLDRVVLARSA